MERGMADEEAIRRASQRRGDRAGLKGVFARDEAFKTDME
jgi:hypothetical protein